tara:strand:- start:71 stop:1102 length:1032 start_codon:yes stop_codon:yes gene_type:complete
MLQKRVNFPKSKQKSFLEANKPDNYNWREFSDVLNVNYGTLNKAYRYEYCKMPYSTFKTVCKLNKKSIRNELKIYRAVVRDQETILFKSNFGLSRLKISSVLPPNNEKIKLDISGVNFSRYDKLDNIKLPDSLTPLLAEEVGIHVGDGFLSESRNEYRLKGNKNDEKEYYDRYIRGLYKKLYNLDVPLKEYETTYGFEKASKAIWAFKYKVLGIKPGRKDNMEMLPIIKNSRNTNVLTSFIRGIFDTDGSVSFKSMYGYGPYYPVISVSLKSKKLIDGIYDILKKLGLKPMISPNGESWRIDLCGYERMALYSKAIGWSNPKHLNKVRRWKTKYPKLAMAAVD